MTGLTVRNCSALSVPDAGPCTVRDNVDIEIRDGLIAGISPAVDQVPADADHEVIDGRGLLAVPGLTNSHTHSPMALMRGAAEDVSVADWFNERVWPMEVNLDPERVHVGARLACAEMLLSGVTTFVDHYFYAEQIAQAAVDLGIRADIAPTFFSSQGTEGIENAFAATETITQMGSPLLSASVGPHSAYTVEEDHLREVANFANATGRRVHIHAAENLDQTHSSLKRLGITPIKVLERTGILEAGVLIAHGCGITPADLPTLGRYNDRVAVACCPKVYLKHALKPITPIRDLHSIGIAVGAGTDGAAGHNTLDVWEALRLVALVTKHQDGDAMSMTVSETLRLAFRGGAAAAGVPNLAGDLAPGQRADIALLDLSGAHNRPVHDPRAALVYSVRASDVTTVLVDGKVVVRDRQLETADLTTILRDADTIAPQLVQVHEGKAVQHYDP